MAAIWPRSGVLGASGTLPGNVFIEPSIESPLANPPVEERIGIRRCGLNSTGTVGRQDWRNAVAGTQLPLASSRVLDSAVMRCYAGSCSQR